MNKILSLLLVSIALAVSHAFSPSSVASHKNSLSKTSLSASPEVTMVEEVKVGDKIPSVVLKEGQANYEKPVDVNISELVKGKKVAIFAVPGAFTPGCSKSHLPSFITAKDELKAKGVDIIICVATNDAYVMQVRKAIDSFLNILFKRMKAE